MENRKRNKQIILRLSEEEFKLLKIKYENSKVKNMNLFLLKCIFNKNIYHVDMNSIRKIYTYISNIASNINQITRVINTNKNVYIKDINDIQSEISKIKDVIYELEKNINLSLYGV